MNAFLPTQMRNPGWANSKVGGQSEKKYGSCRATFGVQRAGLVTGKGGGGDAKTFIELSIPYHIDHYYTEQVCNNSVQ